VEPYQIAYLMLMTIAVLAVLSIVIASWRNGISPMPSSVRVRRAVAVEVNRLSGRGLIVEAGAGWGTLGIYIGKHCPGWQLIGIENSFMPLWVSRVWAWLTFGIQSSVSRRSPSTETSDLPHTSVAFQRGNIYKHAYANASLVVCYLYPGAMKRLSPIFREQLDPEARVISICFALPDWQPERVITCSDLYRTRIYIYPVYSNVKRE